MQNKKNWCQENKSCEAEYHVDWCPNSKESRESKKVVATVLTTIAGIILVVVVVVLLIISYLVTVGMTFGLFVLVGLMIGVPITWNVWIAGLIVFIVLLLLK